MVRLPREFYLRDTVRVARDLLGKVVMRRTADGWLAGRIVETEAYHGPLDAASHAHRGETPRNAPMFGEGGFAYVYQVYGVWVCLNAVTREAGFPAAVLVRAIAPVSEGGLLETRTGAGPGKLCRALGIDKRLSGLNLVSSPELWFADDGVRARRISAGPRVGVDYAGLWAQKPWRFWIAGNASVSRKG